MWFHKHSLLQSGTVIAIKKQEWCVRGGEDEWTGRQKRVESRRAFPQLSLSSSSTS